MAAMKPRERVWATLRGDRVDRPPISFWGHAYDRESSARDLVDATVEFQRRHGWDWVKLNPRKHYHVEDWGVRYRYSARPDEKPRLEEWPIRKPEDWRGITSRPENGGSLGEQLAAVRMTRERLPADVPLIQTVFTPLAILAEMVPEPAQLKQHMRSHPDEVHMALEAITSTFERYVTRVLEVGADGIYLATTDWASRAWIEPAEHQEWSRPYDLRLLARAVHAPFNVLHVCKPRNLLWELSDYPVHAFSWDATHSSNPSLADGLGRLKGAVMGGISQEDALQQASPERVLEEFREGMEQTEGRRWLVAPGCSIPPTTPAANLEALRTAVESHSRGGASRARADSGSSPAVRPSLGGPSP
jgi:uroporphyrinogen decarboxylase